VLGEFILEVSEDPQIFLGEVATVVVLSSIFESIVSWCRRQLRLTNDEVGEKILDVLFKEITGLGFIGLLLFVTIKTGIADAACKLILGPNSEANARIR